MIVKGEAIVLRCINYSNSSQIATFFTRGEGKVGVIGKGTRKYSKSSLSPGSLELLSHLDIVYYYKPAGSLATLKEYDVKNYFPGVRNNLNQVFNAFYILELVNECTVEQDPQKELFEVLLFAIKNINEGEDPTKVRLFFQNSLLHLMGSAPDFRTCQHCGRMLQGQPGLFSILKSNIYCLPCRRFSQGSGMQLDSESIHYLQSLSYVKLETMKHVSFPPIVTRQLDTLFRFYFRCLLNKELKMTKYISRKVIS